ncbi:hypothetical protein [Bacteroides sp.]
MKKEKLLPYRHSTLYKGIAVSLIVLLTIPTYAGTPTGNKKDKSAQSQAVSGHSIKLNGIGLAYNYEYAFSPRGTIIFSAGSSYTYGWMLGLDMNSLNEIYITTKDYHLVTGDISVEPRFYYNLQKRHRKNKRTFGNSGGYLALNLGYSFPIAITDGWEASQIYSIVPYWGFRRVWRHFLFDLAGGVGYAGSSNGNSGIYPALRIGLGYRF